MEKLLEALLSAAAGIIAAISFLIVFLVKRWKNKVEKRDKEIEETKRERILLAQDYNFTGGAIKDINNQLKAKKQNGEYAINLEPDIREAWIKTYDELLEKYHSHDITKK